VNGFIKTISDNWRDAIDDISIGVIGWDSATKELVHAQSDLNYSAFASKSANLGMQKSLE